MSTVNASCQLKSDIQMTEKAMAQIVQNWGIKKTSDGPYMQPGDQVRKVDFYDDDQVITLTQEHFQPSGLLAMTKFDHKSDGRESHVVENKGAHFFIHISPHYESAINLQTGEALTNEAAKVLIEACLQD